MRVRSKSKALGDSKTIQPVMDGSLLKNIGLYTGKSVNPNAGLLQLLLGGNTPVKRKYRR